MTFTYFGFAETINRVSLIVLWTITAVFWTLSMSENEWLYWFFTIWARTLHYLDVIRVMVVILTKSIGFFADKSKDYKIADGTSLSSGDTELVSME